MRALVSACQRRVSGARQRMRSKVTLMASSLRWRKVSHTAGGERPHEVLEAPYSHNLQDPEGSM